MFGPKSLESLAEQLGQKNPPLKLLGRSRDEFRNANVMTRPAWVHQQKMSDSNLLSSNCVPPAYENDASILKKTFEHMINLLPSACHAKVVLDSHGSPGAFEGFGEGCT